MSKAPGTGKVLRWEQGPWSFVLSTGSHIVVYRAGRKYPLPYDMAPRPPRPTTEHQFRAACVKWLIQRGPTSPVRIEPIPCPHCGGSGQVGVIR